MSRFVQVMERPRGEPAEETDQGDECDDECDDECRGSRSAEHR